MDWGHEFLRFATHAAAAAALVAIVFFARKPLARLLAALGAMSRGRTIVLVLGLTIATRLALTPFVAPAYETDVREYCEKAVAIAHDGNPRDQETRHPPGGPEIFYRTLGYSLPLAGWYRLTGVPDTSMDRIRSAQEFDVVAACGVAVMLLALGRALGRETAGRVAAVLYACHVPAMVFALIPYAETWATFLLVASALAFERLLAAQDRRAVALGALFGLLQGLLFITRTEFGWIPLVATAWLARRLGARALVPVAAGVALFAVPFAVNHEMREGYPGHLRTSVQGGLMLYYGNNPIEVTGQGNATPAVRKKTAEYYDADPTGGAAARAAFDWMKSHPFQVIANAPKKLYHLWLAEPQGLTWQVDQGSSARVVVETLRHLAWAQALALLAFGVAGLRRLGSTGAFWTAILALHALAWCFLAASSRNRYPLEPLLLLAAAAWVVDRSKRAAAT